MLTKKSKYALKALIALGKQYEKGAHLRISEISEEEGIPRKFLEAILVDLKRNGILGSKMGATGGYFLEKHPKEIKLSQVIRLTNGPIALISCASLNYYEPCEECPNEKKCGIRAVALEVRDATLKVLENTSLADMIQKELSKKKQVAQKKKK